MKLRADATGFGEIQILQDPEAFCYGADAVLLAGFAAEVLNGYGRRPDRLCDLGTGTGIIPLILSHKTSIPELCGLEVQDSSFLIAEKNIALNHLENRLRFFRGNVRDCRPDGGLLQVLGGAGSFDAVTCNPPYTAGSSGIRSDHPGKVIARHETCGTLRDFLSAAALLLKYKGDLFLIHRPSRLTDILTQMRECGIELLRFKTGTPARIDGRTVDFSKMTEQKGDDELVPFSFTNRAEDIEKPQVSCWLTYTTEETHEIIRRKNAVCFSRTMLGPLSREHTFDDLKAIPISHLVDDHSNMGWVTSAHSALSAPAKSSALRKDGSE